MDLKWMPRVDWEHLVPARVGKIRANHISSECSGGRDSMVVERKDDGRVSSHCFRCGRRGSIGASGYYRENAKQIIDNSEKSCPAGVRTTEIPKDLTDNWERFPLGVKLWLIKAYITPVTSANNQIKWSNSKAAIYIPVMQAGKTTEKVQVGYVIRWFNPKDYRTQTEDTRMFFGYWRGPSDIRRRVVLVEDAISAIRVSEFEDAISLMGTSIKDSVLKRILDEGYTDAVVFLDGDNSIVKMKTRAIAKRLAFLNVRVIETGRDPKSYSVHELQHIVNS